ncbi:MAG: lipopolysaccharide biosynthesis protein [Oscillospiraceae bacterium]
MNQVRLGAVLSYVSMGPSTLISLIYTPIMLGRLGETEYGVYGAVGPIISYLLLLSMGLGSAYIRYYSQAKVAKDRREMAKLNGMFLVTLSLLGLVLLALGFFLAAHPQMVFGTKWAPEELALGAKLLRIMTLNAALSFPFSVFESHVNIHERYLFLKAVTMAKSVLSPLISIPLLLLGFRSPAIATLSLVLTIVCGLTYMAYCFAVLKMPVSFRTYDLPLMKNMMGFTFYIFLAVVVDQLNYGIGTLMTTWIHGADLSGVYYSANQLNVYYLSFAMAISNVLIPRVHRMVAEGDSNRELTRLMTKAGRLQFIMLMAVFLGFVAVGRPFVILWAGGKEQFAVDYPVALLLFASTIVSAIQFVGLEILRAKNMHRFRAWVYLAAAAVNVGLMIPCANTAAWWAWPVPSCLSRWWGTSFPSTGISAAMWAWMSAGSGSASPGCCRPCWYPPSWRCLLPCWLRCPGIWIFSSGAACSWLSHAASLWLFGMNRYERGIVTGVLDKFRRKRRRRA